MGAVGFGIESVVPVKWYDILFLFQKKIWILHGWRGGRRLSKDNTSIEPQKFDVELWDWKSGCLGEPEAASGESSNPLLEQN